jgi:hypothetical protein
LQFPSKKAAGTINNVQGNVNILEGRKLFKLYVCIIYTGVEFLFHKKHAQYFGTKNNHSMMIKEVFSVRGENHQTSESMRREQNLYYFNFISGGNYIEYRV